MTLTWFWGFSRPATFRAKKICTPLTRAVGNVCTNFSFSAVVCFGVRARRGETDGRTEGRTDKTPIGRPRNIVGHRQMNQRVAYRVLTIYNSWLDRLLLFRPAQRLRCVWNVYSYQYLVVAGCDGRHSARGGAEPCRLAGRTSTVCWKTDNRSTVHSTVPATGDSRRQQPSWRLTLSVAFVHRLPAFPPCTWFVCSAHLVAKFVLCFASCIIHITHLCW